MSMAEPFSNGMMLAMRVGPLEFGDPVWLWGLLLLAPVVYFWKTSRVAASAFRKWVSLSLRILLILALIFSLADTRLVWFNNGMCVVFVLDQSQSVPGPAREAVRARIAEELQNMKKDDRYAIVEFGADAVLEALPSPRGAMPPMAAVADTGHTDIARALRLAMATFPNDRQKRIVLFSDGDQNQEDALREARIAGVKDVDINVLQVVAQHGPELLVDQLIVPAHVRKDARFNVRAIVSSDVAQSVKLIMLRDGALMASLAVQLKAGSNVIDVPDNLSDGGNHQYQATVTPDRAQLDTYAANNTGYAFTQVDSPGQVLLVRGSTNTSTALYEALRSVGVPVVQTGPDGLPGSVNELAKYDCVILDNVSRFDIDNTPQIPALKDWVTKYGGGLVMIGGDNSFGPGGYKGTALEDLAPVEMDVKRQKHLASLAIVIVMDKSGSMGMEAGSKTKMELADAGAAEVLKILEETDQAQVGAVDTEVKWMGPSSLQQMTPSNKRAMTAEVESVRAGGGGIYCETALSHAYDLINARGVDAMSKHVILFADTADSEQKDDCVKLAAQNLANGITTSVIGLGNLSDPDVPFLKELAQVGGGRFFSTDNALQLPRIFLKEAFLVSRRAFVEDKNGITPALYPSPILEGFLTRGTGVKKIYGYVGTTLKPQATLAMHGAEPDDPLLAHWSIGLGKCVAYTSDSGARWGQDWLAWDGYAKFWSQVIRWASRGTLTNGITTTTVLDGNEGRVVVDATDPATGKPINGLQLRAAVISPERGGAAGPDEKGLALEQIAPGRYSARFPAGKSGTYLVGVSETGAAGAGVGGGSNLVSTGGGILSYPPEFRDLQPNAALLLALADASGGTSRDSIEGVFQSKPGLVHTYWPLWQILLVLATCGLFGDVAWRRLNVADWFRRRPGQGMPVLLNRTETSVGAMKAVKSGRRDVDSQRTTMREKIEAAAAAEEGAGPPKIGGITVTEILPETSGRAAEEEKPADPVEGYANRLMSAKKRAKEQIREQEKDHDKPR